MSEKHYVGMGYDLCPVCGVKTHETVLLDKRLKPSLERENWTGWTMCDEHKKLSIDYIALVETVDDPAPSQTTAKLEDVERTGRYVHVRRAAFNTIFGIEPPTAPLGFVGPGVIEKLLAMQED